MSQQTAIEWTDLSWNPVHGCSKVSPGCAHCYAETLSLRYKHTLKPWTPANAAENVILKPHKLREPLSGGKDWRGLGVAAAAAGKTDGQLVFVNSTSDLFHEQIPDEYIAAVFGVMAAAPKHTFQVLTKRPERMLAWFAWHERQVRDRDLQWERWRVCEDAAAEIVPNLPAVGCEQPWPLPNVWLGVSIENRRFVHRADLLRETPAAVRFISAEPLLGPLIANTVYDRAFEGADGFPRDDRIWEWSDGYDGPELDLTDIDWLIVGGESGPRHRPISADWVCDLREATSDGSAAFFFKQWGGDTAKAGGRDLDGIVWNEFPRAEVVA